MAKLTKRQKTRIIAEYIDGDGRVSQETLAKRYGVSRKTISKILSDKSVREKLSNAKNESVMSMIEYIQARSERVQHLVDVVLDTCEEQLAEASLRDKMGAVKIMLERFCVVDDKANNNEGTTFTVNIKDMSGNGNG